MSKIKSEKDVKELFGYNNSFGRADLTQIAKEVKGLSQDELIDSLSDDESKTALLKRKVKRQQDGRGRPKNENSDKETRMTFVVNKEQLEKIREIGYRNTLFVKEILFEALDRFIKDYEEKYGEVIPQGKSKIY